MEGRDHLRGGGEPIGESWPPGWTVRHVAETGSTNADLLAEAAQGAAHRTVVFADHQTAGRGRLDRTWSAPPGANLLASILFTEVPDDPGELMRRVGLAVLGAIRSTTGVDAALKWPNDVEVDDRKVAGILAERAPSGAVVVGFGLNVGWAPDGAARLHDAAPDLVPPTVLRSVLEAFDALPTDIDGAYRSALATIGRRVRVELPAGEIVGTATDVEPDGRLVVLDDCALTHRVAAGDIVHLRPA